MRAAIFLIATLLTVSAASAQADRDKLIDACLGVTAAHQDACTNYLIGFMTALFVVSDSVASYHAISEGRGYPDPVTRRAGICMPDSWSIEEVQRVLRNHVRARYNDLPLSAGQITLNALQTRYGCERDGR